MKRQLLGSILFLSLLSINLFAQKERQKSNAPIFRFAGSTTIHQVTDSVVVTGRVPHTNKTFPVSKILYENDKDGNALRVKTFAVNGLKVLVPANERENTFEPFGKITQSILSEWDTLTHQFINKQKINYTYPLNDICKETLSRLDNNNWVEVDSFKTITTYNTNQDPLSIITYTFEQGKWIDSLKEENIYDSSNVLTEKNIYQWNSRTWQLKSQTDYFYNPDKKTAELNTIVRDCSVPRWDDLFVDARGEASVLQKSMAYSMVSRQSMPIIEMVVDKNNNPSTPSDPNEQVNETEKVQGFYLNAGNEKAVVNIFALNGKRVIHKKIKGNAYIKLKKLHKGTFWVKITINGKTINRKLFIK